MRESPFLPQGSGSRRVRALARRRRRRRRALVIGAIALVAGAAVAVVSLAHSGASHDSASASAGSTVRSGHSGSSRRSAHEPSGTSAASPASSSSGPAPGHPPLTLDLSTTHYPVQVAFHHPPRAGLLFDLDSGRVLWALDPTRVLPIASLTKMMTALLVVRARPPHAKVLITRKAVDAIGSKVGLLPLHKHVSLETLLYGLLLPSGNDAAVALAENVSGSAHRFVTQMNAEAAHLGLRCTHYTSPDGLEDTNRSCAADLAELAHVDLAQPRIAAIVRSASAVLPFPIKGGKLYLYNNNPLLRYAYPGATGLKTGETEAAGKALVGSAQRAGVRLGVVLLHSPELGRQAAALLNRGFYDVYGQKALAEPLIPAGQ